MKSPLWIIGLGITSPACLSAQVQEVIGEAGVLIGGSQQLNQFADHPAQKVIISKNIKEIITQIKERGTEKIVILTSGAPGFHSIAGVLLENLPEEDIQIIPNVSSLQEAFARVGVPWNGAVFTSAHAHSLAEIIGWVRRIPRLGILTDLVNTPAVIAETLLACGAADCRAVVAENLGTQDEKVTDTFLSLLPTKKFSPLNVLLLLRDKNWLADAVLLTREDEAYSHRSGLITKRDLRLLSIARLQISPNSVVWDIGAGSGAVSIEMANLAWQGKVFAVEKETQNLNFIKDNRDKFGMLNLNIVAGEAPEILAGLPAPQAVFIGGSGGKLAGILQYISRVTSKGCRITGNFATLENLNEGLEVMKNLGWRPSFSLVNISQSRTIGSLTRLEPLNPIFILEGTCP